MSIIRIETRLGRGCVAVVIVGILTSSCGLGNSAGNFPLYDSYTDLSSAADMVISAEVVDTRREFDGSTAELDVLVQAKGEPAAAADNIDFHYTPAEDSNFRIHEGERYIFFVAYDYDIDDGQAYELNDVQGTYSLDGKKVLGFSNDSVELPQDLIASLGGTS